MDTLDWLKDFNDNFVHLEWLRKLKEKKFIGNIQLNFFKGEVLKIHKTISAPKKQIITKGEITNGAKTCS